QGGAAAIRQPAPDQPADRHLQGQDPPPPAAPPEAPRARLGVRTDPVRARPARAERRGGPARQRGGRRVADLGGSLTRYRRGRRSRPGGRAPVLSARGEESPDSAGQDAGESQAGATSRRGNRKQTASALRRRGKGETVG